jgi:hypothetical protein
LGGSFRFTSWTTRILKVIVYFRKWFFIGFLLLIWSISFISFGNTKTVALSQSRSLGLRFVRQDCIWDETFALTDLKPFRWSHQDGRHVLG